LQLKRDHIDVALLNSKKINYLTFVLTLYSELYAGEKAVVRRAMVRSDTDAVRLMRTNVYNNPSDGVLKSAGDFLDSCSGLDQHVSDELVRAFNDSDDVADGVPGEKLGKAMKILSPVGCQNVVRLRDTISRIPGYQSDYTGLAGKTRTAWRVAESKDDTHIKMDATVNSDSTAGDDFLN
jgi:hypothetical protein